MPLALAVTLALALVFAFAFARSLPSGLFDLNRCCLRLHVKKVLNCTINFRRRTPDVPDIHARLLSSSFSSTASKAPRKA